jgi:hypothetical protein
MFCRFSIGERYFATTSMDECKAHLSCSTLLEIAQSATN